MAVRKIASTGTLAARTTLAVEVHVFPHRDSYFAFDARNYSILKLDRTGAVVLSRMGRPLDEIIRELAPEIDSLHVQSCYLRFLKLIQDGTLSDRPVAPQKRPLFNRIVLMLASGCNMGCAYCFEKDVPFYRRPAVMTREMADHILDWFIKHQEGKYARIQLYGGEPLLNWPVLTYVVERMSGWARENDIDLSHYLITNGTLLDDERIQWLASHGVLVQVSVDGDGETHDRFRLLKSGEGTFDKIRQSIEELSRQRVDFNLRAVITRRNTDPAAVIDGLRSLGAEKVSFEVVATDNPDARLTEADWDAFNRKYLEHVGLPYESWYQLTSEMRTAISRICNRERASYGCGAGISEVTVAPDGSIYECERLFRGPYARISDDMSLADLDSRFLTMVDERPICRDCWARYLCGGGCMHQSYTGGEGGILYRRSAK